VNLFAIHKIFGVKYNNKILFLFNFFITVKFLLVYIFVIFVQAQLRVKV